MATKQNETLDVIFLAEENMVKWNLSDVGYLLPEKKVIYFFSLSSAYASLSQPYCVLHDEMRNIFSVLFDVSLEM